MSELLFVRHAETDLAGTFCGHSDPPINARGQQQVDVLVADPALSKFDAVYCSDLQRARSTAEPIAAMLDATLHAESALREIYFGGWEGMSWAEIEEQDTAFANRWAAEFPFLPAPGGERYEDFKQRVLAITTDLVGLAHRRRIVVVTHGGVMRLVLMELCGKKSDEAWALTKSYCSSFLYVPVNPVGRLCK